MREASGLMVGVLLVSAAGCGAAQPTPQTPHAQRAAAEHVAAQRDALRALTWQNVALHVALHAQRSQLQRLRATEQQVRDLQKLAVLNRDLDNRLEAAEEALAALTTMPADGQEVQELPSRMAIVERTLEVLRASREQSQERDRALRALVTNVQHLIDTRQIRVGHEAGRARLFVPRSLDQADPWSP